MAIANFIPEFWSQELNLALRKTFVGLSIINQDYSGEIQRAGDTVHINRPNAITVNNYVIGTPITYEIPTSTQSDLVIDQQKYFGFQVDDIEEVQSNVALVPTYITEANEGMSNEVDIHIFGKYVDAAASNIITKLTLDPTNIYSKIAEAERRLSANNVSLNGRWMVLSPFEVEHLVQADKIVRSTPLGDLTVTNGWVGTVLGFNIFMSNNLSVVNDGANDVRHCLYGTNAAITFAMQLTEMEALRSRDQFADDVRGLMVYGSLTIKPEALGDFRSIVS